MSDSAAVVLDLDVGNTRIKWRCSKGGAVLGRGDASEVGVIELGHRPTRVRVSSVASAERDASLAGTVDALWGVVPEFAETTRTLGSVTCAYAEPGRMGVDRWLAVLGAWDLCRTALAVIDLGTAVTLDFVDSTGAHQGGYIVPGTRLMLSSLFRDTADVKVESVHAEEGLLPGASTAVAVQHGVVRMLADFIEASVARFERQCENARVFLCGGDADLIARHLSHPYQLTADLVLDGLAIALP